MAASSGSGVSSFQPGPERVRTRSRIAIRPAAVMRVQSGIWVKVESGEVWWWRHMAANSSRRRGTGSKR
jgi:hypothetical protein